ncbi:DUF5708 family protein [Streptomyces sp. NPDC091377]|uniref:DUF5708 family protein n=1 Tax=unclassified Streptomyces TaxID=2593676 RepID=UPI00381EA2F3
MKQASKNLREGGITFTIGLALRLFTDGVDTPVVTLTKVGVALMFVGGGLLALGTFQSLRSTNST